MWQSRVDSGRALSYVARNDRLGRDYVKNLTVKTLAARSLPAYEMDQMATVVRQIRHWTTLGAMTPLGSLPHTGTGKAREYRDDQRYVVAMLRELSRYNLSIGLLKMVGNLGEEALGSHDPALAKSHPVSVLKEAFTNRFSQKCIVIYNYLIEDTRGHGFGKIEQAIVFTDLYEANVIMKEQCSVFCLNISNVFNTLPK